MKYITFLAALFFAPAAFAQTCMTDEPFPFKTSYSIIEECPDDIQNLLNRINACVHFSGEEPYDEDRAAFLDEVMSENRCDDIGCDFEEVFMNHEGDIAYTGVLFEYAELVYGDYDNVPSCEQE